MKTRHTRPLFARAAAAALFALLAAHAAAAEEAWTGVRSQRFFLVGPAQDAGAQRPAARAKEPQQEAGRAKPQPQRRPKTEDELVAEALAESIREALREPREGETRVRAVFSRVECGRKGMVFVFRAGERTLRLTAAGFEGLHLMSFNPKADTQLTCGARKTGTPSVVTYRASADAKARTDGSLVALEFVPADFQLKK